jgi:hypothetical protein
VPLLAQIVASTSRADCARLFLKEGGLDQLQDWLREAMQAALDFPSCRAQIELLLIALLIAIERLRVSGSAGEVEPFVGFDRQWLLQKSEGD